MNYHELASLVLVALLAGGLGSVGAATPHAADAQPHANGVADGQPDVERADALRDDRGTDAFGQRAPVNLSEVDVSALEATRLAQNRTGGKAVVARLTRSNGTPVFNVTVLHENLSVTQVTVDATDRAVTAIRRNVTVVRTEFLGGEAFDYGELRTAAEAIRLVENRTNGTVVSVGIRRGELVYGVALRTPEGRQTQALVTATDGPILGIRSTNATGPTTTTTTG